MSGRLVGRRIAILAADGVEQVELTAPRDAVVGEGATAELLSIDDGEIQAMEHDITPAGRFPVDRRVGDARAADYDGLLLPGGVANPDKLRQDAGALRFVRGMVGAGKPVGVICHGPWALVEADLVRGRTLTSYPSIRTDIANAGGVVVDEEVVEEFAEGVHDARA